ncbi:peptidase M36 [Armillaria luteobubalina]|uniref:Extracellular metalloproteinase n=1 Tax=Armillaria luteobubalina TaxID=153913 RepID=A0AA39NXC6_9AGAR|nr:peptidase M36 [Armillaria luteobubalina]
MRPKVTDKVDAQDEAYSYINATVTQLFYTTNIIHDFYYRYGFDEVSGNFQQHNFGRGGEENDTVIANSQDGSGYNNANLMTPPDGRNGRMRMYLWNTALLWVVEQRLIVVHGFSEDMFPPAPLADGTVPEGKFYRPRAGKKPLVPKHGNSLIVQLVVNGIKLQPCRPGFFEARDAIIQADEQLTGGENFCTLWKAFAERGLGVDSRVDGNTSWGEGIRTNGYAAPTACQ